MQIRESKTESERVILHTIEEAANRLTPREWTCGVLLALAFVNGA